MSIEFAQSLIDAGIPVVVCRPNPRWAPGERELYEPKGWAVITADECDLSGYRPGVDTLAMVGGHGVDVVDVDPKDGGSVDNMPPFRSFGETRTPSGGFHRYVRSTGIAKMSPLTTSEGHVGDYVGGTAEGGGRMLAYLPGSTRPKYAGETYTVTTPLDLDALLESDPDDLLVDALIGCGGRREGKAGKPAATLVEVESFLAEHSELAVPCNYGRKVMKEMIDDANDVVPGDPKRGRHGWAVKSAAKAVELVRAGCASSADLAELEATLDRIKPEGGTDWYGCLAWALANADGGVACGIHGDKDIGGIPAATIFAGAGEPTADDITETLLDANAKFTQDVDLEAYKLTVREAAQRKVKAAREGSATRPPVVPLGEFLAVPDTDAAYRVDGIWPTGGRIVLSAQYKAGKSTLVGNIVRSLADGEKFLDAFDVTPAKVLLIDNELDERTLRRWLRDHDIVNTSAVRLVALRGKTSSFDILDPETRAQWAKDIAWADVVIFDCLRPVLDALGLSEDKDAGKFLVAFDALLDQAGVPEALIVHHMGHSGERSRGDSRILDWPDATWKLVRGDPEDPSSARYFSAFGRDVDVTESKVDFHQATRRLTLLGGNRKEAAADELIEPLLELLGEHPEGLSGRQIDEKLKDDYPQNKIRAVLKRAKSLGLTMQTPAPRRAIIHRLAPSALSASEARQRTGKECVSASLDNAHTLSPAEEQNPSASVTHSGPEVPEEEAPPPR